MMRPRAERLIVKIASEIHVSADEIVAFLQQQGYQRVKRTSRVDERVYAELLDHFSGELPQVERRLKIKKIFREESIQRLLKNARDSMDAAEVLFKSEVNPAITAFHCAQAVKFSFKAYLASQSTPTNGQNLEDLLKWCIKLDSDFGMIDKEKIVDLNEFGKIEGYLDLKVSDADVETCHTLADEIIRLVVSHTMDSKSSS